MTDPTAPMIATWPVSWTCDVSTESPAATGLAAALATEVLWALTGRRFGYAEVKVRPCLNWKRSTPYPDGWLPWPGVQMPPLGATSSGSGGYLFNAGCGSCSDGCSCLGGASQVELPASVNAVTEVKIDGSVMPLTAYRLDGNILIRTDGYTWPQSNNLLADDTALGTWTVTARYGETIPGGAMVAMGELACELLRAMNGQDCRLPRQVTQLARQGVTISMPDLSAAFEKGSTGLYLVDLFINTWNPKHLKGRARTFSVDTPPFRRVGT